MPSNPNKILIPDKICLIDLTNIERIDIQREALCFVSMMNINSQVLHFLTGQAGILNNILYWPVAFHHIPSDS